MCQTTALTASTYRTLAAEARTLRASIATYSKPMDAEMAAWVLAQQGQAALDALVTASAEYLAQQQARLAEVTALTQPWEDASCHRCQGTGIFQGPSSRTRRGVAYCFTCGGSGKRA